MCSRREMSIYAVVPPMIVNASFASLLHATHDAMISLWYFHLFLYLFSQGRPLLTTRKKFAFKHCTVREIWPVGLVEGHREIRQSLRSFPYTS